MKKAKFKVGDRVRIRDGKNIEGYYGGWVRTMAAYVGKICTISNVEESHPQDTQYGYRLKEVDFTWDERGLEAMSDKILLKIRECDIDEIITILIHYRRIMNATDMLYDNRKINLLIDKLYQKRGKNDDLSSDC